jgi:uncharacterized protein (DUF983 family)
MATSLLEGVFNHKCPHCREGNMYKHSAFNILHYTEMHSECPVCKQSLEPEPGFYYGAMYIGYAISVATIITTFFAVYFLLKNPPVETYLSIIIPIIFLMMPLNFRYSRTLMLYLFGGIKYRGNKAAGSVAK